MGQQLQRLRQQANLSQADLARQLQIPIATLRNWEHDRRRPKLETAVQLARILRVTMDDLVRSLVEDADGE